MTSILQTFCSKSRIQFGLLSVGILISLAASAFAAPSNAERTKIIRAVNHYFKSLDSLKGTFVQTNPDKKWIGGKFYIQ